MIQERAERLVAEAFRFRHHHPKYPGEITPLEPQAFLNLPFTKQSLTRGQVRPGVYEPIEYDISAGWFYSKEIREVFKRTFGHSGIDYVLPYGHEVVAPFDGYAMSSYDSYPFEDSVGRIRTYKGINLHIGVGYFVQLYNPEQNRFVQLGHLSNTMEKIPFSMPVRRGSRWTATSHTLTPEEIMAPGNTRVVFVKRGEPVGFVGYSGLTHEEDYIVGYERPYVIDPKHMPTWSFPHIHMDEFYRNYKTGQKDWRRDPYDIYMKKEYYPTHSNTMPMGREPLFKTDQNDRPHFADS